MTGNTMEQVSTERWDAHIELPERRTNMPVTLSHRIEAAIMGSMFWTMKKLGVERASGVMGGFLRSVGPLLTPVQKRGLENLRLIYPENSEAKNKEILSQVWENLGRTVAEYAHLTEFSPFVESPRLRIENESLLRDYAERSVQAVYVSAHMGNWELMAQVLHRMGIKCAAVYRAANNPIIDEKIIQLRAEVMSRYLIPKNHRSSRELVRAMNDNYSLCMLVDQKLGEGIVAPFLGKPALTAPSTARVALKYNVPIVPLSIRRQGRSASFVLTAHEPIIPEKTGDMASDTEKLTVRVNDALSEMIDEDPGQWLWFHRRWKQKPVAE